MDGQQIKQRLLAIAEQAFKTGPGYGQQGYILREAASQLGVASLQDEQALLTAWYDLLRDGDLSWGYNLSNPDPPFVHLPLRQESQRSLA